MIYSPCFLLYCFICCLKISKKNENYLEIIILENNVL